MPVAEHRHARAGELADEIGLRLVHDDKVRLQREDPFDVGIEQAADSREAADLGRKPVEGPDADDPIAGAHVEEHLRGRRDERDDSAWAQRNLSGPEARSARHDADLKARTTYGHQAGLKARTTKDQESGDQAWRNSSHRKNGPSDQGGDDADRQLGRGERDAREQVAGDQERRAEQRRRRQDDAVIGADQQPDEMRHDDADERRSDRRARPRSRSPATR